MVVLKQIQTTMLHITNSAILLTYKIVARCFAATSQAIKLNPEYSWSYHSMGEAMAENGKIEDAIIAFRRATELNSNFSGTYNTLGILLAKVGRIDEASICYERFLELELRNYIELPRVRFSSPDNEPRYFGMFCFSPASQLKSKS